MGRVYDSRKGDLSGQKGKSKKINRSNISSKSTQWGAYGNLRAYGYIAHIRLITFQLLGAHFLVVLEDFGPLSIAESRQRLRSPYMFSAVTRINFDLPKTDGPSFTYCRVYAYSSSFTPVLCGDPGGVPPSRLF